MKMEKWNKLYRAIVVGGSIARMVQVAVWIYEKALEMGWL